MATKDKTAGATLKDSLSKLDVDRMGLVRLADWRGTRLEESALKLLPQARSAVVLAMEIYPETLELTSPGKTMGVASLNDLMEANANFLYGRLTKAAYDVARVSRNLGLRALPLPAIGCPLDGRFLAAVFSYKHTAQAAGMGALGKSSLLITPDFGPRVRLACCLTEADLEPTGSASSRECGKCRLCIESCPAGALSEPPAGEAYAINKSACNLFRSAGGACFECLRVCPEGH